MFSWEIFGCPENSAFVITILIPLTVPIPSHADFFSRKCCGFCSMGFLVTEDVHTNDGTRFLGH